MSDHEFPVFQTTDLAHADVFNEKVRTPGEAARASLNQHRADKNNPHETTLAMLGGAPCPHGNECHNPPFLTSGDVDEMIVHDNAYHNPNFATDSDLAAHIAQTRNHGVHGLSPNVTSSSVTYYISQSFGSDSNNGTTEGTPFQTWGAVRDLIPPHVRHTIEVRFIGNYSGAITLSSIIIGQSGTIRIRGNTDVAAAQAITGNMDIYSCVVRQQESLYISHLRFNDRLRFYGLNNAYVQHCEFRGTGTSNTDGLIYLNGSDIRVENCDFGSNGTVCIRAFRASFLSRNNSGTAVNYGLRVSAGVIYRSGTQPTGNDADTYASYSGIIA